MEFKCVFSLCLHRSFSGKRSTGYNYRDMEDDKEAGKNTTVVIFGRKAASTLYLFNGYIAMALLAPVSITAAYGIKFYHPDNIPCIAHNNLV